VSRLVAGTGLCDRRRSSAARPVDRTAAPRATSTAKRRAARGRCPRARVRAASRIAWRAPRLAGSAASHSARGPECRRGAVPQCGVGGARGDLLHERAIGAHVRAERHREQRLLVGEVRVQRADAHARARRDERRRRALVHALFEDLPRRLDEGVDGGLRALLPWGACLFVSSHAAERRRECAREAMGAAPDRPSHLAASARTAERAGESAVSAACGCGPLTFPLYAATRGRSATVDAEAFFVDGERAHFANQTAEGAHVREAR
jgi:hypothetical protein